ncbi:MAG TPA: protein-L-isoaspartate O-methyltransferase [Acidisphaera sp.]|nr:protein-L-isoaspartate O-methyltransferase [Acidisphaera sp.]
MDAAAPTSQSDPYAEARANMVDSQVRPNKVTDPRIIAAMRRIRRETFLPPELRHLAYVDDDVALPHGRALMVPMVIARLIQVAQPMLGERALVVAAGVGYGASVLAACDVSVTALEEDPELIALARAAMPAAAPNATLVTGKLADGWPAGAPWDIVIIDGAVHDIPPAIAAQVKPHTGRLVTVMVGNGRVGQAVLAEPSSAGLSVQPVFDCNTPPIPAFLPAPGFVF